jgi:DNA-binding MarR family transcriptional regulator
MGRSRSATGVDPHADASATAQRRARARKKGARARPSPRGGGESERAVDARVDLGILPGLLGYNLRRAHQVSWRTYVSFIGKDKIRPGLFSLMCLVRSNPGISQIELGTHLGVDKTSIVALLDRLERDGWLQRKRSTRDRRRQGICLTEAGAKEFEVLVQQVRALERHMASRFNPQELKQFLSYLGRMYA